MPTGELLWQGTFAPFFINLIDLLTQIGTASFIFEMKVCRAAMPWHKTVSCRNGYLP